MTKLISKVQYRNFETGEFIDAQERNCDETIKLIESFPWNNQRDKIVIDLTNPSVTIEGKNNDFLKYALFFNDKYVLHYFDKDQVLFTKSFSNLQDGYTYVRKYFDQQIFEPTDFKKEVTWFQHNLKHFITQDFNYVLTPKATRSYLLSTSGINFCFSIVFLAIILLKGSGVINPYALLLILIGMFVIGGGVHLALFFNYYNYVKDKILIMSKGNDIFYFGTIDNPVKYTKKDILQVTTIRPSGSRNQFGGFAIVKIEFKDGTVIKIPNLLVGYAALENKLSEYHKIKKNKFPYLRL